MLFSVGGGGSGAEGVSVMGPTVGHKLVLYSHIHVFYIEIWAKRYGFEIGPI